MENGWPIVAKNQAREKINRAGYPPGQPAAGRNDRLGTPLISVHGDTVGDAAGVDDAAGAADATGVHVGAGVHVGVDFGVPVGVGLGIEASKA